MWGQQPDSDHPHAADLHGVHHRPSFPGPEDALPTTRWHGNKQLRSRGTVLAGVAGQPSPVPGDVGWF